MGFLDQWTAASAVGSSLVYVFLHLAVFRFSRRAEVVTWLVKAFWAVAFLDMAVFAGGLVLGAGGGLQAASFLLGVFSSLVLCGILCFSYVVCIVGPYETSVRIRIIREVQAGGRQGISLEQLARVYNNRLIFETRIARLTAAGDFSCEQGKYIYRRRNNVFTFMERVSTRLRHLYGLSG